MTAEQQKTVAFIRADSAKINGCVKSWTEFTPEAADTFSGYVYDLLEIIDDLQNQQPKRYTENQMEDAFCQYHHIPECVTEYTADEIRSLNGWLDCARFLGMIKTEVES